MIQSALEGIAFDIEHSVKLMLRANVQQSDGGLIGYQLRMMQENQIPRLLPISFEEVDAAPILRYDITAKRRLIQALYTDQLSYEHWIELVHRIVKVLHSSRTYMLSEDGYLLGEDFVYIGHGPLDVQLCYVPVIAKRKRTVTDELRCLLLRTFSMIKSPIPAEATALFAVLGQELYTIEHLYQVLKKLRLGEESHKPEAKEQPGTGQTTGKKEKLKKRDRNPIRSQWIESARSLWSRALRGDKSSTQLPLQFVERPITGRTELLTPPVNHALSGEAKVTLTCRRNGDTAILTMSDDRFLIGRHESEVHYTDPSEGVSRIHCEIVRTKTGLEVKDLGSTNGTTLNGEMLIPYKSYPFTFGDVLKVVRTEFLLHHAPQSSPLAESGR